MAYITNDGSRLIERARTEGKSIVFGSVRMNTIYKSDPYSLVQQTDEWFGENHGSVVGCISHVSVYEVSQVCDSKLAIQCNDNGESWKSLGIYARLDGEDDEVLLACESIENGEYKDVTIVELPVTLDGVVADFGLSEGGSGSGGGGGGSVEQGFDRVPVYRRGDGSREIGGSLILPDSEINLGTYATLVIDSNSKIASVRSNSGMLDVSVAVFDNSVHRVSGIVNTIAGLSFASPITPEEGQEIYVHWALYA